MPVGFFIMINPNITTPVLWLQEAGYSAYLVGNQVRDALLRAESDSHDVDIATTALPEEVIAVLRKNNIIPKLMDDKFGVVNFVFEGYDFETTTFRQDIYHFDTNNPRRYPDQIKFVKLVAQDALRRDFTVNAIYFNPKTKEHLDYVDGLNDLSAKRLRVIGEPGIRFQEDPLRILRAIRFKHVLGLHYDPATAKAIKQFATEVRKLSPGVIKKELAKLDSIPQVRAAKAELMTLGLDIF